MWIVAYVQGAQVVLFMHLLLITCFILQESSATKPAHYDETIKASVIRFYCLESFLFLLQLSLLTPPTAVNFNNVSSSGRPQLKLDCEYIMQSNLLFEHLFL